MYYTDSYWQALLQADDERRAAYETAVHRPISHDARARDVKAADDKFERRMRDASRAADTELALAAKLRSQQHVVEELVRRPERLAQHKAQEAADIRAAKIARDLRPEDARAR